MIIYNLTINIESSLEGDWKKWMKEVHIPDVMNTGFFSAYKFCRLLHQEHQGTTYAVQYFCPDRKSLERYLSDYAPPLQKEHLDRYGQKVVAFRTFLEVEHSSED